MQKNVVTDSLQNKIYTLRGMQVMLDRDLAQLYDISTKVFNQAVKRNIAAFPQDFRFQLSKDEFSNLRFEIVTSNSDKIGLRYTPYAFTEQGISMLSAILKSDVAINISIKIIRLFVEMRHNISSNILLSQEMTNLRIKQSETEKVVSDILDAMSSTNSLPKEGVFYDGEVFDAYIFISKLIKSAKHSIALFDNYIDETTLALLSKNQNIEINIYTNTISKALRVDLEKYNTQYNQITLHSFKKSHDRFIILDDKVVYHIGASLKDLGKKWFAFSKMDIDSVTLLEKVKK